MAEKRKNRKDSGIEINAEENIEKLNTGMQSELLLKRKRGRLIIVCFSVLVGLLVFGLFIYFTLKSVFAIDTIVIEGSSSYTDEEILDAIGLKKGDIIFTTDENLYARRLAGKCICVYAVKVEREYPSYVKLTINEEIPEYRFESGKVGVAVSKSGKVLYAGSDMPEKYQNLIKISVPAVERAMAGYGILFSDSLDNRAMEILLDMLEHSSIKEHIVFIDMSSRFNVKLKYDDRFEIQLGDTTELNIKLKFCAEIIKTLKDTDKGTLNVKSPEKGYYILD